MEQTEKRTSNTRKGILSILSIGIFEDIEKCGVAKKKKK